MAWVRVDDAFADHRKFAKVGPAGVGVWLAGLAYCNRNLTDGFIPWAVAQKLLSWSFLGPPEEDGRQKVWDTCLTTGMMGLDAAESHVKMIGLLLEAGLWEDADGGYRVHDYHDYQPSKAQVLAERESTKSRQKQWRERNGVSNGVSNGVTNGPVTVAPNPTPKPEEESRPVSDDESVRNLPQRSASRSWMSVFHEKFWTAYPRKQGKGAAMQAWGRLQPKSEELAQRIVEAVGFHCRSDDWNKDDGEFIPHPATWLNQKRWLDDVTIHGTSYAPTED